MTISLPVLSCDGCGECCRHQVMPPFVPDFFGPDLRNDEFDAFKRDWPELAAGLKAEYERKTRENDWPDDAPCFWFDQATGRCKHYEARPEICRDFEVGCDDCLRYREEAGIGDG